MSVSTALVERTARMLEDRLSRRSLINRSAFVGSAVAVGSGLDLALQPGHRVRGHLRVRERRLWLRQHLLLGLLGVLLRGQRRQLLPREHGHGRLVGGRELLVLRRPAVLHGLQLHLLLYERVRRRVPLLRAGVRPDRMRLRVARLRLLPHRLPAVPVRPVQPGRALHGPHRLPCRRLRAALDRSTRPARPPWRWTTRRRSRTSRAGRRRRPRRRATRRHELPSGRPGPERGRRRLRRADRRSGRFFAYGDFTGEGDASELQLDAPIVAAATCTTGGLLAGGSRRRDLRLRRGALPRLHGRPAAQRADRRHGGHADRPGLLARGGRRGRLRLRRRAVLRLHGRPAAQRAGGRDGGHADRPGLLARGGRRWRSSTTATRRSSAPWAASPSTRRSWAWRPRPRARATGSWRPTVASSPTGTRCSTARPARSRLDQPVVGMAPPARTPATGSWPSDGGIFAFGTAPFLGSP